MWPLLLLLAGFLGLFVFRVTYRRAPRLRLKPGESEAEARLILQGTYRVYTWLTWLMVVSNVLLYFNRALVWSTVGAVHAVLFVLWLVLARAIYWRLSYDWRTAVFLVGHVTMLFAISEVLYALPLDLRELHQKQEDQGV